jgi:limonene-1,2-epoxide hydrolase
MTQDEQLVRKFCAAWVNGSVDELMPFFADDAVYHNIPLAPVRGTNAIRDLITGFFYQLGPIRFEIIHCAAGNGKVFTERVDTFKVRGHQFGLPVCGIFELEDSRIKSWRDYFDLGTFNKEIIKAGLPAYG